MKRALLLLLCGVAHATAAQPLGRLFYSAAERARLEQLRGQPVQAATVPRAVGTVRHDGIVVRSSGPVTWFVNGGALDARALPSLQAQPAGTALQLPGNAGEAVRLRPGEQTAVDEAGQAAPASGVIDLQPGRSR
ncbi:hypothetical protein [Methyloversatilis sp. XJ19-49]|uniref:hypothetical protein n=1 Tax=Methyloversatilis sp. XJ19-49 TaxID=2963429 RepID=UPI00211CBB5A|nr:hypothetical protein [Methyloversatilis sp. XJ19-49]